VLAILADVLGTTRLGLHDDFFDAGGHSLSAVRALSRINAAFRTQLPVRVLFEARTAADLASALSKATCGPELAAARWPALIPINQGGHLPPLFCVARPNVNALGYVFLSRQLGSDQPVYGLQAQLQQDPDIDFTDEQYDAATNEYLAAVRSVQPHGPYHLIGQCQGAFIAFRMACRLADEGESVGLLGILDTWPVENTRRKWVYYVHYYAERLANLSVREAFAFIRSRARVRKAGVGIPALERWDSVRARREEMYWPGNSFQPSVFPGKISVFRIASQPFVRIRDSSLGWSARAGAGVEIEVIPGGHTTVLREPHVRVLAEKIASRIGLKLGPNHISTGVPNDASLTGR
jgi:thioesterase domain-containing protein